MKLRFRVRSFLLSLLVVLFSIPAPSAGALNQIYYSENKIYFFDRNDQPCSLEKPLDGYGIDYSGRNILSEAQKDAVEENKATYIKAANEHNIPWPMLAALHLAENSLLRVNPPNDRGIYQFSNPEDGEYPSGFVNDDEFLRQSTLAAEILKEKAAELNLPSNRELTKSSSPDIIKDTFFSYSGRLDVYKEQAKSLGYSEETQPFEGSPYVVNKSDPDRDPIAAAPNSWGKATTDGTTLEYPANNSYGIYVFYSSILGVSINSCDAVNSVTQRVVDIAKKELDRWESGELSGNGRDFKKYTGGTSGNWCAWFSSWIYNEAGYPLIGSNDGRVAAVQTIWDIGVEAKKFIYHDKRDAGGEYYKPKVGDMVIQKNGVSHVHIVVAVNGDMITTIGGNQGWTSSGGQAVTSFTNSRVTGYEYNYKTKAENTGYVSPNIGG